MWIRLPSGFSIIEVLVALVLVSVGVASAFSLQTIGIKTLNSSRVDNHVDWLARDLLERIRANPSGQYQLSGEGPSTACSVCLTGDEVAQRDLYEWWAQVRQSPLPGPTAFIIKDTDSGASVHHYSVVLQWDSLMPLLQVNPPSVCQGSEEGRACYVAEALL